MKYLYPVITDSGDIVATVVDQNDNNADDTVVRVYNIKSDHCDYDNLLDAVKNNDVEYVEENYDAQAQEVSEYVEGSGIEVRDGEILFDGRVVHNVVVDRIFEFMDAGEDYQPLVNFLGNLMRNPSHRSVDQLYNFLQHKHLAITPDGCFLAYKSVRSDYHDHHSGKFSNHIGATHKMPRNQVADDADVGCSSGFHVGSLEYATTFNGAPRVMLVKVNPEHVVSVPKDSDCQKCRVCEYQVVAEYQAPLDKCCYNY